MLLQRWHATVNVNNKLLTDMTFRLSTEQSLQIITTAFAPLLCTAEAFDAGRQIRFRVMNSNGVPIETVERVTERQFSDARRLESIINAVRGFIGERGVTLDHWKLL
ncbi:MAG TPA: hypothetical protein VL001_12185 [Candidimonas sp.]|nr:hypothetical protein [Candidimonas sp.]